MAKRKTQFNWQKLDGLLEMAADKIMAAESMDCSEDTIERRIREHYNMTFSEYRERKLSRTKLKLNQVALTKALGGENRMLELALKNFNKWTDRIDIDSRMQISQIESMTDEELEEQARDFLNLREVREVSDTKRLDTKTEDTDE